MPRLTIDGTCENIVVMPLPMKHHVFRVAKFVWSGILDALAYAGITGYIVHRDIFGWR